MLAWSYDQLLCKKERSHLSGRRQLTKFEGCEINVSGPVEIQRIREINVFGATEEVP